MGEGGGGKERKAFLSFSSLPFSLPSFPFSPRNARNSGYKKTYELYPVHHFCTSCRDPPSSGTSALKTCIFSPSKKII